MKLSPIESEHGYTITFVRSDDGQQRVARRCDTREQVENFIESVSGDNSGWTEDEIASISVIADKYFILPDSYDEYEDEMW